MNFKKLPNGKYRYREKFKDREGVWREAVVTLNSKGREAQREARNIIERKIKEKLSENEKNVEETLSMTVEKVYNKSCKKRELELAPSSFQQESYIVKKFVGEFGKKKISEVKAKELQNYLVENCKSVKMIHATKRGINSIFRYAYVAEYIDNNPVDRLDLPKDTRTQESVAKLKQKFFTLDEFNQLVSQMRHSAMSDEESHRKIDLFEFLFWTGLRIGEALGLLWSDIDVLEGKVSITKSWNKRTKSLGNVKTIDSVREIDVNTRCMEIVQNFKGYGSEFVFVTPKGKHFPYIALTQYLKYEGAKAQIFGKNPDYFSLHMLRHSHVTYLINAGVPEKIIMERVGHRDPRMMMGVYTHVLPENRLTLRQALGCSPSWEQKNILSQKSQNVPKALAYIVKHDEGRKSIKPL